MALIPLAIQILWLLIGIIVILGVVWLAFMALSQFGFSVPQSVKNAVYLIILILILIFVLTMLAGGGTGMSAMHLK
jgi:hypothetical protein